jgi:hypothetical protein
LGSGGKVVAIADTDTITVLDNSNSGDESGGDIEAIYDKVKDQIVAKQR